MTRQEKIRKDYISGKTMAELREKYGCSRFAIKRALVACGGRR